MLREMKQISVEGNLEMVGASVTYSCVGTDYMQMRIAFFTCSRGATSAECASLLHIANFEVD